MAQLAYRTLMRRRWITRAHFSCPHCRHYATPSPPQLPAPPLLLKLRSDLKTAMKEKDTSRLNVLRALIADITNAAKTSQPIKTDMQLLSLLRKRAAAAKTAATEFHAAERQDLMEKEQKQADIMEEYAGSVETMSADHIREAVNQVVEQVKAGAGGKVNAGDVMKRLLAPGGILDGKSVEKAEVAKIVKEVLAQP